jgi:hypothetical protein
MTKRKTRKALAKSAPPKAKAHTDGRQPGTGRFAPGNTARLVHGQRSRRGVLVLFPDARKFRAQVAEQEAAIVADLGGRAALSTIALDTVRSYIEKTCIREYLGARLMQEGPLSPKGRQRALLTAYLAVSDRVLKLATTLGLDRKTKPVDDLTDYLKSKGERS